MKTDSLLYKIFSRWPELIFKLANIPQPATQYTFASEEIKQTSNRIDGVLKPPDSEPKAPIIILEVQIQKDHQLYSRIFKELFAYLDQHEPVNPWQVVVIYPSEAQESNHRCHHYQYLLDSPYVHILYLDKLLYKIADTAGLGFLKLIFAAKQSAKQQAIEMLQQRDKWRKTYGMAEHDYLKLLETIMIYKFPKMTSEDVRIMLDLQNIELKDTQFYKDVFAEVQQEYQLRDIALAQKFLTQRLGKLPEALISKLSQLSAEQADCLLKASLDFNTLDEVEQWLKRH